MKLIAAGNTAVTATRPSWLKRIGILGFAFFLIKGLVWLGVAGAATWFGISG